MIGPDRRPADDGKRSRGGRCMLRVGDRIPIKIHIEGEVRRGRYHKRSGGVEGWRMTGSALKRWTLWSGVFR